MIRFLRLLLALVAVLVIVAFAIGNRAPVNVSFWPLPLSVELPVYGVFLLGLVLGVLIGGLVVWFSAFSARREARRQRNRAWALENQLNILRQERERAEAERAVSSRSTALAPPRTAA